MACERCTGKTRKDAHCKRRAACVNIAKTDRCISHQRGGPVRKSRSEVPVTLKLMHVPGDGSCLFHSILLASLAAKGLDVTTLSRSYIVRNSKKLRQAAVDYVIRHLRTPLGGIRGNMTGSELILNEYASSSVDGEAGIKDGPSYKRVMSKTTTYAGNTELIALSALLKAKIVVHVRTGGESEFDAANTGGRVNAYHLHFDPGAKHYMPYIPRPTITRKTIRLEPARVHAKKKTDKKSSYKKALSNFYPV